MRCPRCQSATQQTVEETKHDAHGRIRRRRRCGACREHYTTLELISERSLKVRKSDGRAVPFDRGLIRTAIQRATVRKYRKQASDELDEIVERVFNDAYRLAEGGVVPSEDVGGLVLKHLKPLAEATHIRFALVQLGRRDRDDGRKGWVDADDVRDWLMDEYPALEHWRPPGKLVSVVKRSGEIEAYDRDKLEQSIGRAAKGRRSKDEIYQLAEHVARAVYEELADQPMVTSGQIAAEILRALRDHDHIAYLRYASGAKNFQDAKAFEAEAVAIRKRTMRRFDSDDQ